MSSSTPPRVACIVQVRLKPVAYVEEVAQYLDGITLQSFSKQGGNRHFQVLPEQVQQCQFDGGDCMDRDAKVEALRAAPVVVAISKSECCG